MADIRGILRKRKVDFGRHLVRSLDIMSYSHLLYIYFMDVSLMRLLLRSVIQLNYLTPKPFSLPQTAKSKIITMIVLGSNLYCFIVHLFGSLPASREASGGYLHGGLTIEFIGQQTTTSRLKLLFSDIIVVLLQITIFQTTLNIQENDSQLISENLPRTGHADPSQSLNSQTESGATTENLLRTNDQTIEDEERGLRAEQSSGNETDYSDGFSGETIAVEVNLRRFR
ncbi:hypothetical protein V1514DRAFT_303521 [Lipomyces japonicus]|uniref:uncharacterized protein n=1 Tax=Lipomyces japonicus TaxID=56871 RepID=UPI0034CF052C